MTTRRNVLTILGLAGVASPAIASDDIVRMDYDGSPFAYRMTKYDPERLAAALERLAAEVRKGHEGVHVARFNISSEAISYNDDVLRQTLTIDIEIMHPDKSA